MKLVCEWEQIFEDTMICEVVFIKGCNVNLPHAHESELHRFPDSSLKTYGCCIYIKINDLDGTVTTSK